VVAGDHQHQHALGQVREHGEEVHQQPAHDAKLLADPDVVRRPATLRRAAPDKIPNDGHDKGL
jgi:hypothetical protein